MSDDEPGRYDSPLEAYPGYIKLPYPLMLPQFKQYWELTIVPVRKMLETEEYHLGNWDYWQCLLDGALMLIMDYGEWAIEGVTPGDAKAGNMPLELSEWLIGLAREYITPQLDPKRRPAVLTVI